MRILVVEDEKRLAQNLQELLRREGYTVDVSNDGVSGLDNALSGIYDLLVLDVMLPGLDGFALLRRLRSVFLLVIPYGKPHPLRSLHCNFLLTLFLSGDLLPVFLLQRLSLPIL